MCGPKLLERWGTVLRILRPYDLSELKEQAVYQYTPNLLKGLSMVPRGLQEGCRTGCPPKYLLCPREYMV